MDKSDFSIHNETTPMKERHFTHAYLKKYLPTRTKKTNKTHGGKLVIVGGSRGMYGAALLSALAATRCGSGYTYLSIDWTAKHLTIHPDLLFLEAGLGQILKINASAYVVGPGMGRTTSAKKKLDFFIRKKIENVVLDADGLNLLAKKRTPRLPKNWILTPHEGELARLLKTTPKKIRKNPVAYLNQAQKKYQCTILLKGHTTYISDGNTVFSSHTGTPALAKAGTGDVLAGIIGALLAQGLPPVLAAACGAYVHGITSQKFLESGNDVLSLRPLDLIELLPKVLKSFRR